MAAFLRPLSYKYQWFYDSISRLAALGVGGEKRFCRLALPGLSIAPDTKILDLCCGVGQTIRFLRQSSHLETNLIEQLKAIGFSHCQQRLYLRGSLQAIQTRK
jgi:ubiquinone/menaquinone biosynthesis C-methylase UbiE